MKPMKRCAVLLLTVFLWVCLASGTCVAGAGAEESKEDWMDLFLGGWLCDGFSMYMRLEDDQLCGRISQTDGDDVWELSGFEYDADEERLYCMNCIHYREFIDWDTYEIVQEDWSLTGLAFSTFDFKGGADTLTVCDIPHLDGDLELHRVSDEVYFGF